jgi:hypothetical protein
LNQGLAFCGHDESEESSNQGNFIELLKWLVKANEEVNKVVLNNAPGNCILYSPSIQHDIIDCCAMETTRLIIEDLDGDHYAILTDESSDVSHKEQLALCLRYVDKLGRICERLLGVVHVSDTTSLSLKVAIISLLKDHHLSPTQVRGQGYDGASNMKGEIKGLKRPVACLTENPPLLVSEFIDRTASTWDVHKLNIHMVPFDVQIIRNIPITTRLQADFWAWHHDRKGLFTVHSVYGMLAAMKEHRQAWFEGRASSSDYRVLQGNWTNLWHISVLTKMKLFPFQKTCVVCYLIPFQKHKLLKTMSTNRLRTSLEISITMYCLNFIMVGTRQSALACANIWRALAARPPVVRLSPSASASSPPASAGDEVLTRQCPCLRAFDLGSVLGRLADSTSSDRNRGCTRIYPGSAPRRVKTYILLV